MNLAFWRSGRQGERAVAGPKKVKVFRPWQIRQWLGLDDKGKPKFTIQPSLNTRQRQRAAFRALSFKEITEKYGGEPRHARRGIALKLAQRAFREHRKAA